MRREGSALHGFGVVTLKEIADHFTSILVVVLVVLVVGVAVIVVRGAVEQIKEVTAEDPFLFLRLFTRSSPLALVALLSFLVPLVAIGLGFDSVNGEHNRRTLSRIMSQPIYRDALLFGKFAAGLFLFQSQGTGNRLERNFRRNQLRARRAEHLKWLHTRLRWRGYHFAPESPLFQSFDKLERIKPFLANEHGSNDLFQSRLLRGGPLHRKICYGWRFWQHLQ